MDIDVLKNKNYTTAVKVALNVLEKLEFIKRKYG
jgi:hypothetical protein